MKAREAITIRFPIELIARVRAIKGKESLNDLVVAAVEGEVRRRQGLQAFDAILRIRAEIQAESGLQPDSTPLIRSLRDDVDRHI